VPQGTQIGPESYLFKFIVLMILITKRNVRAAVLHLHASSLRSGSGMPPSVMTEKFAVARSLATVGAYR